MTAAAMVYSLAPAPEPAQDVALWLSTREAALLASTLLAASVQTFACADRLECAGRLDEATDLMREGHALSRIEMRLRSAAR